jgi:tRNA-binding EMAP/Myf-like protein
VTEFRVEVVRIGEVRKHPNADTLSICDVYGGYPCIFRTGDYAPGDLAVYVPVDALVPVGRPEFKFLDAGKGRTHERVKAKKLRGVFSMGLLVPAPAGAKEGDDVRAVLGVEKWEPPSERETPEPNHNRTRSAKASETARFDRAAWAVAFVTSALLAVADALVGWPAWTVALIVFVCAAAAKLTILRHRAACQAPTVPVYDIEGLRKYKSLLAEGEEVWLSEKVHGCNSRYLHTGKRFYVGSRTVFKFDKDNVWWQVAERYGLEAKLATRPGLVLFGETYGKVQDLKYGVPESEGVRFVVFDAMDAKTRTYLSVDELHKLCTEWDLPIVPTLYRGPWSLDLMKLAEGPSTMPGAKHCREGFVVRPVVERRDPHFGRVQLKLAGEGYLCRKEAA